MAASTSTWAARVSQSQNCHRAKIASRPPGPLFRQQVAAQKPVASNFLGLLVKFGTQRLSATIVKLAPPPAVSCIAARDMVKVVAAGAASHQESQRKSEPSEI